MRPFSLHSSHGFCAWVARLACRPASPGKTEPLFAVRGLGGGLAVPFPAASAAAVALAMRTVGIAPARPGLVKPWFPIMLPWGLKPAQNRLGPQRELPRSPGLSVQQAQLAGGTEPLELGAPLPGVCSSRREVPVDGQTSGAEMSDGGRMCPRRACFPPLGRSRRPEASGPRLRLPGTGSPREVASCA